MVTAVGGRLMCAVEGLRRSGTELTDGRLANAGGLPTRTGRASRPAGSASPITSLR